MISIDRYVPSSQSTLVDSMAEMASAEHLSTASMMMTDDIKNLQSIMEDSITDDAGNLQSPANVERAIPDNRKDIDQTNQELIPTQGIEAEDEWQQRTPTSKYQARHRVWARDYQGGGLLYEAVVRRCLYGVNNQMQVQIGLLATEEEADQLLEKQKEPGWHYFVHFLGWNINWDRWVPEADVLEPTEETKEYAARLQNEHKALRSALTSGKKKRVDGTIFMREWRKRMDEIHLQMEQERRAKERRNELVQQGTIASALVERMNQNVSAESKATTTTEVVNPAKAKKPPQQKPNKDRRWDPTALEREGKLREQNLTMDRRQIHAEKLILPMGLKKALVEEWEVILQCNMVANLPATVTVRQALNTYLESKFEQLGIHATLPASATPQMDDISKATEPAKKMSPSKPDSLGVLEHDDEEDEEGLEKKKQEWVDMVEGIALFFDQALPVRLLYKQELNQHRAIEADAELSKLRKSDLYGCEHLLRLLVHLPAILASELEDTVARPILAKVNDFVRFLHKHQASLLVQSYRRMNEAEEKEQIKQQRIMERKRKRVVSKQDEPDKEEAVVVAEEN